MTICQINLHVHVHVHMHVHMHVHVCVYVYICVRIRARARIRGRVRARARIQTSLFLLQLRKFIINHFAVNPARQMQSFLLQVGKTFLIIINYYKVGFKRIILKLIVAWPGDPFVVPMNDVQVN